MSDYDDEDYYQPIPPPPLPPLDNYYLNLLKAQSIYRDLSDYNPYGSDREYFEKYGLEIDNDRKLHRDSLSRSWLAGRNAANEIDLQNFPTINLDNIKIGHIDGIYPPSDSDKVYDPAAFYKGFITKIWERQASKLLVDSFN